MTDGGRASRHRVSRTDLLALISALRQTVRQLDRDYRRSRAAALRERNAAMRAAARLGAGVESLAAQSGLTPSSVRRILRDADGQAQ